MGEIRKYKYEGEHGHEILAMDINQFWSRLGYDAEAKESFKTITNIGGEKERFYSVVSNLVNGIPKGFAEADKHKLELLTLNVMRSSISKRRRGV